jgi:predicted  nucleic acid-binding Zn-ribbon protein
LNIREQIQRLIELQHIDTLIFKLDEEKSEIPNQLKKLESNFEEKKNNLLSLEEKLKKLELKRKEKELEISSKEEKIKKFQIQLFSLKTNKEYQAMIKEIEGLKAEVSILEEEVINLLDEISNLGAQINREKEVLKEEEKKYLCEKKKIEERANQINQNLEDLEFKRKQKTPLIENKILSLYERILKNRDYLAIVAVRDSACRGCNMTVTPQIINEIKMNDRVVTCEVCNRILYLEEELK